MIDFVFHKAIPILDGQGNVVSPKVLEAKLLEAGVQVEVVEKGETIDGFMGYSVSLKKTADNPRLSLPVRLVEVAEYPELVKEMNKNRNERERDDYHHIYYDLKYVYQLVE